MQRSLMKLAGVAALAAGMALAQAPATPPGAGQGGPGMGGAMRQRMLRNLNLTDAQKTQAKAIFQEERQTAQPLRAQMTQNRQALAAAVKNNDAAQIQQLSIAAGHLQGQMLAIRSTARAKFYAILTPDQKAKADQVGQRVRQMMRQRAGRNNG
jgi:periplasmic protein CpxP/Spy